MDNYWNLIIVRKKFLEYWADLVREAAQKSSFLSGPATKAFSPPPLDLVAKGTFFP